MQPLWAFAVCVALSQLNDTQSFYLAALFLIFSLSNLVSGYQAVAQSIRFCSILHESKTPLP